MIKIQAGVDTQGTRDIIEQKLRRMPIRVQVATERAAQALQPLKDEYAVAVGAVKRPIEWTSEKQRRAFFATDGFGKGIPYQRTGKLQAGWGLFAVSNPDGSSLVLQNKAEAAKYVYGFFGQQRPQQRFHVNTGWQTVAPLRERTIIRMVDVLTDYLAMEWGSNA